MNSDQNRRAAMVAALGFARLELQPTPPELAVLKAWLGSWTGIGAIVTGMAATLRPGAHQ